MLIQTGRLTIRNFEARDIDAFAAYRNDEEWMRFQGFKGLSKEQYAQALLSPPSETAGMQLAVVDQATGALIGDLYLKAMREAYRIGYTVAPGRARQGYATEAVLAVLAWLKAHGCRRVYADVMPGNQASIGLLRKLGFKETGANDEGELIFSLHDVTEFNSIYSQKQANEDVIICTLPIV